MCVEGERGRVCKDWADLAIADKRWLNSRVLGTENAGSQLLLDYLRHLFLHSWWRWLFTISSYQSLEFVAERILAKVKIAGTNFFHGGKKVDKHI